MGLFHDKPYDCFEKDRYVRIPIETVRQQNAQIARAIDFLNETGYTTDISALRKHHPGLMDFETWLKKEGTAKLAIND